MSASPLLRASPQPLLIPRIHPSVGYRPVVVIQKPSLISSPNFQNKRPGVEQKALRPNRNTKRVFVERPNPALTKVSLVTSKMGEGNPLHRRGYTPVSKKRDAMGRSRRSPPTTSARKHDKEMGHGSLAEPLGTLVASEAANYTKRSSPLSLLHCKGRVGKVTVKSRDCHVSCSSCKSPCVARRIVLWTLLHKLRSA